MPFSLFKENRKSIHIAPGCANAFLTLEDNSLIHYYCSKSYSPDFERGVRFNDPSFNFEWPCEPKIISDKDYRQNLRNNANLFLENYLSNHGVASKKLVDVLNKI